MSDLQKFMQASFTPREAAVPVPEGPFREMFGKTWTVRALNGIELARVREAGQRLDKVRAMVAALAGDGDKATAIQELLGVSDSEVPMELSQQIEILTWGSVDPVIGSENRDAAVKLSEVNPVLLNVLTSKIKELTGDGWELGKPKRSTKTPASG